MQYVEINDLGGSSDEDEAFLPNNQSAGLQYVNIPPATPTRLPSSNGAPPVLPNKPSQQTASDVSNIQYTIIDFQKTAAIAQSSKAPSDMSASDGQTRKTRHDSSADNLSS